MTVVPLPTMESTRTLPPCSSTKERTSDRPSPAPRCREPLEWLSNQSNTLSLTSGGMPGPESVTLKVTLMIGAPGADGDRRIVRREADGVGEQIIQHLHHAALVADEAADIGIGIDLERDAVGGEPVLDAFGRGIDGLADIDRARD